MILAHLFAEEEGAEVQVWSLGEEGLPLDSRRSSDCVTGASGYGVLRVK